LIAPHRSKNPARSSSFLIPKRVKAKSYRIGSSGANFRNARVISMAVRMFAFLRLVRFRRREARCMCMSKGMISFDGGTMCHPPGSTRSSRTIQRKKRFNFLQALPFWGRGRREFVRPSKGWVSSSTKEVNPGRTVSSPSLYLSEKQAPREPYCLITRFIPISIRATSSPVLNLCLKL